MSGEPEFNDMTPEERMAYFRERMSPEMWKMCMKEVDRQRKTRKRREYKRQQKEREVWGN